MIKSVRLKTSAVKIFASYQINNPPCRILYEILMQFQVAKLECIRCFALAVDRLYSVSDQFRLSKPDYHCLFASAFSAFGIICNVGIYNWTIFGKYVMQVAINRIYGIYTMCKSRTWHVYIAKVYIIQYKAYLASYDPNYL